MCNIEKVIEEFPLRNQFTQPRQSYCKDCKSKMHSNWYQESKETQKENASRHGIEYRQALREYASEYLSTHPCVDCGERDTVVLEFDHVFGKKNYVLQSSLGVDHLLRNLKRRSPCVRCDAGIVMPGRPQRKEGSSEGKQQNHLASLVRITNAHTTLKVGCKVSLAIKLDLLTG